MSKNNGCVWRFGLNFDYYWESYSQKFTYLREIYAEACEELPKGHSGVWNFLSMECLFWEKESPGKTPVDVEKVRSWIEEYKDAPFVRIILDFGIPRGQNVVYYYFKCDGCGLGAAQAVLPEFIVNNEACANALPLYA